MATQHKLSVVGLGKLGICSAACFASKGFKVIGKATLDYEEVIIESDIHS